MDIPTGDTAAAVATARAAMVATTARMVEIVVEAVEVGGAVETSTKALKAGGYASSISSNPNRPPSSRITFKTPSSTNE